MHPQSQYDVLVREHERATRQRVREHQLALRRRERELPATPVRSAAPRLQRSARPALARRDRGRPGPQATPRRLPHAMPSHTVSPTPSAPHRTGRHRTGRHRLPRWPHARDHGPAALMGRHATPAAPAEPGDEQGLVSRLVSRYVPRVVLAATGAATTTLAVAWAGNAWSSAALAGAAVGIVVLAAAWLASTVPTPPGPAEPPSPTATSAPPPHSAGREPVQ